MNSHSLRFAASCWLIGAALLGQEKSQADLALLRDEKIAQPVFQQGGWLFDYDAAQKEAKRRGQPIFAYFTRSYAPCPPCAALEQGALSQPEFAEFAQQVVLFCHVTSQVDGDAHQDLLAQKGGRAFPYLVFLDADGAVAAKQVERTVAGFVATRGKLATLAGLEEKHAAGDAAAGADALQLRLELGQCTAAVANERLSRLGPIPAAKLAALQTLIVNAEVEGLMADVRTKVEAAAAGRTFLVMAREGRIPSGRTALTFYSVILETHEADRDAAAYEATLAEFKKRIEGERNADRVIRRYEMTLQKLKLDQRNDG